MRGFSGQAILLLALVCGTDAIRTVHDFQLPSPGTDRTMRTLLGESDHKYKSHEKVPLYANKVGPFHNPR
eukprot:1195358-Prorocentrum_minimum.AAC.9